MTFKEFIKPTTTKIVLTIIPLIIILFIAMQQPVLCTMDEPSSYCSSPSEDAFYLNLVIMIPLYFINCGIVFLIKKIFKKS